MYKSALVLFLASVAGAQECYTGSMPVTFAGSSRASSKPVELVFASTPEYANALIVRDGAREYLTEFECSQTELADCALFDDGGTIRFKRKGTKNAQVTAGKLEVDTTEADQPRIATVGAESTSTLRAMDASACSGEQARVRAMFDRAEAAATTEPAAPPIPSAPPASPKGSAPTSPKAPSPSAPPKAGNSTGSSR